MKPEAHLTAVLDLVKSLEAPKAIPGLAVEGHLRADATQVARLRNFDAVHDGVLTAFSPDDRELYIPELSASALAEGSLLRVRVEIPRDAACFFALNIDDLLGHHDFKVRKPENFAVLEPHAFISSDAAPPQYICDYYDALTVVGVLTELADHVDHAGGSSSVVFLQRGRKSEVPVSYVGRDLLPVSTASVLLEHVRNGPNTAERRAILKRLIAEIVDRAEPRNAFSTLLSRADELHRRYWEDYLLFVSEFSFANERERLEEEKRAYLLELNGALSGVQNRILALPVSILIVGTQMRPEAQGSDGVANLVVALGVTAFIVLLVLLAENQRHSLDAIRNDYCHRRTRWQTALPSSLFAQVDVAFTDLDLRYQTQHRLIGVVNLVALSSLLGAWVVCFYYSSSSWAVFATVVSFAGSHWPSLITLALIAVARDSFVFRRKLRGA